MRLRLAGVKSVSLHRRTRAARSLDHLVRPQQHRRRDRQAERLGGLEVDDELEEQSVAELLRDIAVKGADDGVAYLL
jgi:hypothetical protein